MNSNMLAILLPNLSQLANANSCSHSFLGMETWYHYLPDSDFNSNCTISNNFTILDAARGSDILLIAMAVLDDLIRLAALVAVGYVIWGGIQYVVSQGAPDATRKAQHTIINALIGVGVAVIAASAVSFIGNRLGK